MTNKNAESTQPAAAPVDTWFGDVLAGLGEVIPFASTHAAPDLDPSLYGWLQERGIAPDSHEGQIDMSEVVEALNEHERQLLGSTSAAPGIDLAPRPMATAPRDGTMLRLLVQFDDHATEDTEGPAWTIGACNDDNVHQDERAGWQFAGWCWDHDHFTEGKGTPVGWLPLIDASPKGGNTDENNDLLPELRDVEDYFTSVDPNPIHLATVRQAISAIVGRPKGGSDALAWHGPDDLPDVSLGDMGWFWVAVRRANGRTCNFPASYLNTLLLSDENGTADKPVVGNRYSHGAADEMDGSFPATGWHSAQEHSEYDNVYMPLLSDGDELLAWRAVEDFPIKATSAEVGP